MENDINEPFIQYKDAEEDQQDDIEIKQKIREGFISKVYGIIAFQIIITAIVVYFGLVNSSFQELLLKSTSLFLICLFISLFCVLLPICFTSIYQRVPINYIVLIIFTLSYSWIVAAATCRYTITSVMFSLFLTFITVLTLTVYAWKTKDDFTVVGGTLSVCLVLLIFISIFYLFIPLQIFHILILYGGLVLFSIYLIYDTQLLIGKGKERFSEDDYILAAINIYLDIIILFLKILQIFGEKK